VSKLILFSLKDRKIPPEGQKMTSGGSKLKIANNEANLSILSLKIGQTWKQPSINIL